MSRWISCAIWRCNGREGCSPFFCDTSMFLHMTNTFHKAYTMVYSVVNPPQEKMLQSHLLTGVIFLCILHIYQIINTGIYGGYIFLSTPLYTKASLLRERDDALV